MKKRDILLIIGGLAILIFLWMAPEESTHPVPRDETHGRFYDIVKQEGKKAAEKYCDECHNVNNVPFPENHPPKARCLFCHKVKI